MNEDKIKAVQEAIQKGGHNTSDVEQLARRLQKSSGVDEKVAAVVASEWKKTVGLVAIVLIAALVVNQYRASKVRRAEEATMALSTIQRQLKTALEIKPGDAAKEKDRESAFVAATQGSEILQRGDAEGVLSGIGQIYGAVIQARKGNIAEAKAALEKAYSVKSVVELSQPVPSSKIEGTTLEEELAKLVYAKLELMSDKPDLPAVRARLKNLAYGSQLVTVEAISLLTKLADTSEERDDLQKLAKAIKEARPELTDLIDEEMQTIGVVAEEQKA